MNRKNIFTNLVLLVPVGLLAPGCATPKGGSVEDQRAYVRQMRDTALADLYRAKPEVQARVKEAPGYGVFSNVGAQIIFLGGGYGYGVVVDHANGRETYMRMANVDVGLGLALKDFRAVFIFNDPKVLHDFVAKGWEFGAGAEAGAKYTDTGGEVGKEASFRPIDIYQLTESGAALSATVAGTKYWADGKLN